MKPIRKLVSAFARLFLIALGGAGPIILVAFPGCAAGANPAEDAAACRQNLFAVYRALQAHRHSHRELPQDLADLKRTSPTKADILNCPAGDGPAADGSHYSYEFLPQPLTNELARGLGVTLRDWRQWQMGRIGSDVPMVRCTNHSPALNLSFGGEVYESGPVWEDRFSALVQASDLNLEPLMVEHMRLAVVRIPAREPKTPPALIDLTGFYNGSLNGWLEWNLENNLSELPAGPNTIGNSRFDVRGVVQLGSRHFAMLHRPVAVSNLQVRLKCDHLVFLHGTVNSESSGTAIGEYVVHYEDSSQSRFPIVFGQDVLAWLPDPAARKVETLQPVWIASKSGPTSARTPRLFLSRWINPHPHLEIRHLDFVSAKTQSSPFLVAVSAESGARKKNQTENETAGKP